MKKILFFSTSLFGGGAERVLVNLTGELAKQGYDVIIAINEDQRLYEVDEKVKLLVAPQIEWYRGTNPILRLWRRFKRIRRDNLHTRNAIMSVRPDIIVSFLHCNMRAILKWHGKIPIIHSEHNAYDRKLGLKSYYDRFFLNRKFDIVCVLSSFDLGYASAKGLNNVVFMPNPNTFESMNEMDYSNLFACRKDILLCGRIDAWYIKGFDIAIRVFSYVSKSYPNMFLNIAGGGSNESIELLKNIAQQYGVIDRVHFLGMCENMLDLYRKHQVLLVSSRTEGFPMVIGEAMSQGLPCIAFERLAASIIINEIDGILVRDQNVFEMSKALLDMLKNEAMRYNLGLEGIRNIKRFSKERVVERWKQICSSLISQ